LKEKYFFAKNVKESKFFMVLEGYSPSLLRKNKLYF